MPVSSSSACPGFIQSHQGQLKMFGNNRDFYFLLSSQKAFATVVTAAEKTDANSITSEERNDIIQYPFKTTLQCPSISIECL